MTAPAYHTILRNNTQGVTGFIATAFVAASRDHMVPRDGIQGTTGFFMAAPAHRRVLRSNTQGTTGFFVAAFRVNMHPRCTFN